MNDMNQAIIPKSDQISADDLIGGDLVITITGVTINPGQEQPVSISFAGSDRVFRPCKTTSRVLVSVWGADSSAYVGRSLKLYRDPDVTWAGLKVGGIRIREMSDMTDNRSVTLALTEKRGSRKPAVIKPLAVQQPKPDVATSASTPLLAAARAAASKGKDALQTFWKGLPMDQRAIVSPIMDELKAIAVPVGSFHDDPLPAEDDLARAEAEALAARTVDPADGDFFPGDTVRP